MIVTDIIFSGVIITNINFLGVIVTNIIFLGVIVTNIIFLDVIVTDIIFSISWKHQSSRGKTMMVQIILLQQTLRWRMKHNESLQYLTLYVQVHFICFFEAGDHCMGPFQLKLTFQFSC